MIELANKIISNPTAFTEPSAMAKLKGLKDNAIAARRIRAKSKGLRPGVMLPGFDKDGNQIMRRGVMMPGEERLRRRIQAAQEAAGYTAPSERINSAFRPE